MPESSNRRQFIQSGAAASLAAWAASSSVSAQEAQPEANAAPAAEPGKEDFDGFSRFQPSSAGDVESPYYLGKLVPGFREPAAGPAPFVAPGVDALPWKMKDGAKEFHLICQAVERELLPGYVMNLYGFNGSMPGPTIEIVQGDRVRIVVHNELPEETSVHWHGFELPVQYDGAKTLTQNPIPPGKSFKYEFDVHQQGTFFYHTHVPMQEAFGMVGWLIVHPAKVWDPPVDRDFGLIFQNFQIRPMQTIADSWEMDWNWHTINGHSGPFASPLVVKHGERVRIRILDFSPVQHHPIHLHGHTFWVTGHEGARIPKSAWIPRNNELIAVAQSADLEFVANNPGDWMLHCHMVHHMMNHMTRNVGPRMRPQGVDAYLANLEQRPRVPPDLPWDSTPPGYPQRMQGMKMSPEFMHKIWSRREVQGMRATFPMSLSGLMTAVRVLPEDLYHRVMETDEEIPKGAIFEEIVRRFGTISDYQPSPPDAMHHGK